MVKNKKVLIVSTLAPPAIGGTPIMLGKLFKNIPNKFYAILADPATKRLPPVSKPLSCNYYFFDGSAAKFSRSTKTESKKYDNKNTNGIFGKVKFAKLELISYKFRYFKYIFFDFFQLLWSTYSAYRTGLEVVKREKVSHILAISDNGPSLLSTYLISKYTKIPYSIFLFDPYKKNKFAPFRIIVASFMEEAIIKNASKVFTAGEAIGKLYNKRYSTATVSIPNSDELPIKIPAAKKTRKPLTIVYTGAIYWAQNEALARFKNIVEKLDWVELNIYSNDDFDDSKKNATLDISRKVQREADGLFLPLSFNSGVFSDVIKTASTGKISEYLTSGTPIIVHAPVYAWISKYLSSNNAGIVITSTEKDKIVKSLKLLKDAKIRRMLTKNAFLLAKKNHDLKKNSQLLYNELQEVV